MDDFTMPPEEAGKLKIVNDEPIISSLTFVHEGIEIGKLTWDKDGMSFEGNATLSAVVFFDEIIRKYKTSIVNGA